MPSISESVGQQSQLETALRGGLDAIDRGQTVEFTAYTKKVLPIDGYVFWVATGQIMTVKGSLHYATDRHQDEDQTIGVNRVIFTAEQEVTEFNVVSSNTLWVGSETTGGEDLQVVFSRRSSLFKQADIWHYVGDAVYPALAAQLISNPTALLTAQPIVSNSLPIWLAQNSFATVYPSFLVPDNIEPPYIVAHIDPGGTEAIQQFPIFQWPGVTQSGSPAPMHDLPSSQLMRDRVRLTLYGFNNQTAIQFYASLIEYSLNTEAFGFGNSPAIMDDKRFQVEIAALAQKKTIEIVANYYQAAADAIARRLILSASITTTTATL